MDFTGIVSVTAITVICWLVGEVFSNLPIENKWIPSIVGGFGMLLGVFGWLVMPEFPADNILTAFAVGIVSGLAATGADQVWKQHHPSDKGRIVFLSNSDAETEEEVIPLQLEEEDTDAAADLSVRTVPMFTADTDLRSCFAQDDRPSDGEDQA